MKIKKGAVKGRASIGEVQNSRVSAGFHERGQYIKVLR
jgi:hypothetical protein